MSLISSEDLKAEIHAILKTADLAVVSVKSVREQVEAKLACSLINRKKEFDNIVMDFLSHPDREEQAADGTGSEDASASEEEVNSEEENQKKSKKRPQPTVRKAVQKGKKRKTLNASDSGTESDAGSDSDYEVPKKTPPKKKAAAGSGGSGTGRKGTGFTRAYNLSPELSELMGSDSLPRHEVVKKIWAIIKERNLYDPKNKQYTICDDQLQKIMKVKRFRTFAMLKHLKPHFLN